MALKEESLNQALGRLDPMTYLPVYPHCSAPCHNLQFNISEEGISNLEDFSTRFTTVPYHVSCPVPVSFPSVIEKNVINEADPALQLVKCKKKWEDCKHQILKFCSEEVSEGTYSNKGSVEIPTNVMLLARHLRKDPDPHFNANYNSYFNGTNITCLDSGLDKFLIRPRSYGNGSIVLSRLNLNEHPWDIDYDSNITSRTEISGPIFEINAKDNIILTRQKQNISLFSLKEKGNELKVLKELTFKKDCPYFSVCTNGSNVCTLSADRELEMFDSAVGGRVFREKLSKDDDLMSDNWGSLFYLNNNTLTRLDRSSCNIIDLRMNQEVKKWQIKDVSEHCEEIYSGGSGMNELKYVVTSHQVLSLDWRIGFYQRWTHGIGHSPAVMSCLSTSSTHDMLFVGSQRNDTVVLIENDWIVNRSCSKVQPYALPSLRETHHLARFNGYCLSNTAYSRFNMSLTGLTCIENQGDIVLFSTTSVGDVFKQTLKKRSKENEFQSDEYSGVNDFQLNDDELNKLESWEEECEDLLLELNDPCYVTSDLLDDTNILDCIQYNKKLYEETFNKLEKCQAEWNISKKELLSYCDYLAPKILEEWGIDDEEEWGLLPERSVDEFSSDDDDKDNETERVMKWIEEHRGEMAANPVVEAVADNENREESRDGENNTVDVNYHAFEESEKDSKSNFPIGEPSLNNKMTTSTPKKKFISGF